MKQYAMTSSGKEAFLAMRNEPSEGLVKHPGYRILEQVYESITSNSEDICWATSIPRKEVMARLQSYHRQGLIKVVADL